MPSNRCAYRAEGYQRWAAASVAALSGVALMGFQLAPQFAFAWATLFGLGAGAHFILGLPGETDEMLLEQVATINSLPLTTVKFHQLQVFRGTPMAAQYDADPRRFRFWEVGQYIDLFVEILRRLRPDLVVERFASEAPPRYHYGRNWGLVRNEQLLAMLEKRLEERNAYQGEIFVSLQSL